VSANPIDSRWFFSAPYEAPMIRRGDPLGLRLAAGRYAEAIVPGLSNRTIDARWLTITAWMLVMANDVWRRCGNSTEAGLSRSAAAELFGWLEPLELMWIARTLVLAGPKGRQLPGQRAVGRWLDANQRTERFGMQLAQYQRQRFIGVYGGYRVALRGLPNMTQDGDGWRPGAVADELAQIAQGALGAARLARGRAPGKFNPEGYWRQQGWPRWERTGGRHFIPESLTDLRPITSDEVSVLKPLLFGGKDKNSPGRLREAVVEIMDASKGRDHHDVCKDLEKKLTRVTQGAVARLGAFAHLADTGLAVINAIWESLREKEQRKVPILSPAELSNDPKVRLVIKALVAAAKEWRSARAEFRPEWSVARELAEVVSARALRPEKLVRDLVEFHERRAGGRRWFRFDEGGDVRPASPVRDQDGSPYRFRLFAVARLAIQCKLIDKIPRVIGFEDDEEGQQ
jgi:hypothetical protein